MWNGKDFVQLLLALSFFLIDERKGPNGRTYIENISELILHEKEPVSCLQPRNALDKAVV